MVDQIDYLRQIDADIAHYLYGWQWFMGPEIWDYLSEDGKLERLSTPQRRVLLMPVENGYTEEKGGWVRWNAKQIVDAESCNDYREGFERVAYDAGVKMPKYSDWDRCASYFEPGERFDKAKWNGVPRYSSDPLASRELIQDHINKGAYFQVEYMPGSQQFYASVGPGRGNVISHPIGKRVFRLTRSGDTMELAVARAILHMGMILQGADPCLYLEYDDDSIVLQNG